MSLNQSALKQSLLSAFQSMKDGDDTVFAQKVRRRRQRKQFERREWNYRLHSFAKGQTSRKRVLQRGDGNDYNRRCRRGDRRRV